MCGDYNSVIGMNKENSIKDFLEKTQLNIFLQKVSTLSGIIVEGDKNTGLAKKFLD